MRHFKHMAVAATVLGTLLSAGNAWAQTTWNITGNNNVAAGSFVGSTNAADLIIRSNGAEQMRITSGGNVGINTTTPGRILEVHADDATPQFRLGENAANTWDFWGGKEFHISESGSNKDWLFFSPAAYLNRITIGPSSEMYCDLGGGVTRWGIGVTNPSATLTVDGSVVPSADCTYDMGSSSRKWDTVWACNGTINTSDATLKENIRELPYGIKDVMNLHPVSYNWKRYPGGQRDLGFIAQEVATVVSEVVKGNDEDGYGIFYSDMIPVLVKGIQDQQQEIRVRAAANEKLRGQVNRRAERIRRLEQALGNLQPEENGSGASSTPE